MLPMAARGALASVLLWWCCDMLCTSGLWNMDDVVRVLARMGHVETYCMSIPLQRVTLLCRRAQPNALAVASYWLRRVLDEGGCRD